MIEIQNLKLKAILLAVIFFSLFGFVENSFAATEVIRTIKPSGQGGDYTTLAAWEVGEQRDLTAVDEIAIAKIDGNWSTPDTTAVTIDGWTTDATRYIKIYTTEQARHGGKWDTNKYRLEVSGDVIFITEEFVRVDGIQLQITGINANYRDGITLSPGNGAEIWISNCIIKGVYSGTSAYGRGISANWYASGNRTLKAWNNIIYNIANGFETGFYGILSDNTWASYVFNNNILDSFFGVYRSSGNCIAKNNIVKGSGDVNAYVGTFAVGTDYNATDGTDNIGQGSNNKISQTFSFVNEAQKDFHLASNDLGARDSGANLFSDANLPITDDIDGQARLATNSFDIGADEVGGNTRVVFSPDPGQETNFGAATAIYRSVGPGNTTALAVGTSNTLTITGSTATFSSPLPDRIGVGDALQYDDDNDSDIDVNDSIVFIHSRTDSKTFTVKTASGGSPTSIASDNNWSIFRAYTSLSLAEAGTENTGIDADLVNFDTWTGGKDIATSNEVWNIAAYGDAPDTTAVTIDGWTTDADNFIRIYTPVSKEEVGVSQRHRGKWDTMGYRLEVANSIALGIREDYVRVDGLQVYKTSSTGMQAGIEVTNGYINANNKTEISNTIVRQAGNESYQEPGIFIGDTDSIVDVWNVVAYGGSGYNGGSNAGVATYGAMVNIYSSTIIGRYGIRQLAGTVNVKNCYAYGVQSNDYDGTITKVTSASADTTGSVSLQNIAYSTANFNNVTAGSEDLHIKSNSAIKDVGTNTSGDSAPLNFANDIDGQTRVGSWDIGADDKPANTVIKGGVRITK